MLGKFMEGKLSPKEEDYLRALYEVIKQKGFARVKDLARELGRKPSTIVEMVKKLQEEGYVNYEKYGGITLTPRGKETAEIIEKRHDTFLRFLKIVMVPEEIALRDAHILEHKLDPKTILQFIRLVEFLETFYAQSFLEEFKEYCRKKESSTRE
ncbi:MAG: metal-dependent transcriptional regulator [Thermoproteota archaeon]